MVGISVTYLDHMGNDLTVCNAARVSFDKVSEYEEDAHGWHLNAKDQGLIRYLADHGHWSPFSHAFVSFRIKAPIFVARQLGKHQVGLGWNEVSRRYVDRMPEFYVPDVWRKRAENVKQGSSDQSADWQPNAMYSNLNAAAERLYYAMIDTGICPEQARMVLPQSMLTEWIWSGSLYAFARVAKQRLDGHAQRECREVVEPISRKCRELFPVSWRELMKESCTTKQPLNAD